MLFIVSAPSGTGKTTVVERLVKVTGRLKLSRSYTSRAPRGDEQDGVDYNFVSRDQFENMIANGEFLECADVFGNFYGTAAADTRRCLESGNDVVLVIDVQGARTVRAAGLPHVAIFVLPPSYDVLEQRLRGRSKDSEDAIRRRLEVAREEVSAFDQYDYVVINDELDSCVERIKSIVLAERSALDCMRPEARKILDGFR
ncbi:MAG: guanylate kinase [Acidobacteria bacterium]|nr:guanylate kinase [Acidobacteriota bacterium]